jgi:hypothetical protein
MDWVTIDFALWHGVNIKILWGSPKCWKGIFSDADRNGWFVTLVVPIWHLTKNRYPYFYLLFFFITFE